MALLEPTDTAGLSVRSRAERGVGPGAVALRPGLSRRSPRHARSSRHGRPAPAGGGRAVRAVSRGPRRAPDVRARHARHLAALHASGRGHRPRARRPQRRRHHADGVRQDALLQRTGPELDPAGPRRAVRCISSRRRRSPRTSSPSCRRLCETLAAGSGEEVGVFTYDGDTPQDARRTIRARAHIVLSNPDMLHSGILPHHPRWAKLFENLRYVDHRRAARVPRRVRQPPVQRAAAAAAHLPSLRVESRISLLVGDDRQPARAGRAADRAVLRARRAERRAARREVLRVRQPAGRQPPARHPAVVPERDAAGGVGVPEAEPAADRVRAEPAVHRNPHDVPEGRFRERAGRARAHPRLPGRLPAEPAPRDREGAARGQRARGRLHQRARTGHRHRRARRVA